MNVIRIDGRKINNNEHPTASFERTYVHTYGELKFPCYDDLLKYEQEIDRKVVDNNIAHYRDLLKLSNPFIAAELDMSLPVVEKYVSGERVPSLKVAFKLAKLLGVTVEELYDL